MLMATEEPCGQYNAGELHPLSLNERVPVPSRHRYPEDKREHQFSNKGTETRKHDSPHYGPAGQASHMVAAKPALKVPLGQDVLPPPMQNDPGGHCCAPVRNVLSAASGVEYHPLSTGLGSPEPVGQ